MKINAIMGRKAPSIRADSYSVDDVIVLSEEEFSSLYNDLLEDREYFEERKEKRYDSVLVLGKGQKDGILVDTQGCSYARYTALVPFARKLVDEHIKELTDYAINEARKVEGRKEKIPYEAIQERFGTKLTNENGFGKLFEEALQKREGIKSVTLNAAGVDIVLKPEPQAAEKEKIAGIIQAYPSLFDYIKEMARLIDLYAAQAVDCQIDGKWAIRFLEVEQQCNLDGFDINLFVDMLTERDEIEKINFDEQGCEIEISENYLTEEKSLRNLTDSEIEVMCANHILWLNDTGGKQADFSYCLLKDINLRDKNLMNSFFDGAKFVGTDMRGATLCSASLKDARFIDCNLDDVIAEECDCTGVKFLRSNLSGGVFTHSNFKDSLFASSIVTGASLQSCCVEGMRIESNRGGEFCMNNVNRDEKEWLAEGERIGAAIKNGIG